MWTRDRAARRGAAMSATARPGLEATVAFASALTGDADRCELVELRYRHSRGGMGQRFFTVTRPDAVATAVAVLGRRSDVYLAVCPRTRRDGSRGAIRGGWAVWADCDGAAAAAALEAFKPEPAIVVRSGTANNCHAYWPMTEPLAPEALEAANRRIAVALGSDLASVDAARVLRAPGMLNFKTDPPGLVALEVFTGERFDTRELLAVLPLEPTQETPAAAVRPVPARPAPRRVDDPLRAIDPEIYVTALTGHGLSRERKVSCPFHRDRTPSLHAYETPEDGWYCFGCRRGGSIYDLGAGVMGLATRGHEFVELRKRLTELLLPGAEAPKRPGRNRGRRAAA